MRRVAAERADLVRKRLLRARLRRKISLHEAARLIEAEVKRAGGDGERRYPSYDATQVRRYEGGDPLRQPKPPVAYVEAAARVYEVDPEWLLGERRSVSAGSGQSVGDAILGALEARTEEPLEEEDSALRGRVRIVLLSALGLPHHPFLGGEFFQEIEELFWAAFAGRGLSLHEMLDAAAWFGKRVLTPVRLESAGFRAPWELTEQESREFWTLQVLALRRLIRPRPCPEPLVPPLYRDHSGFPPAPGWAERMREWQEATASGESEPSDAELEALVDELAHWPLDPSERPAKTLDGHPSLRAQDAESDSEEPT